MTDRIVPNLFTPDPRGSVAFYRDLLGVADVAAAHAVAVRAGLDLVHPLTDEPWGVRRFFVRDPAGHVINVVSHG